MLGNFNLLTLLGGGWDKCQCNAFFLFVWGCFLFFIYINKNETRCRATTMPLLTTLWVNQLVLFQHHVTADHRAPNSLAGAVTWPRHGQSSGCTNPLVPQHALLNLLLLQPKPKRQRPTSHSRPISVLRTQMSTTYQQQPSAYQLKQEKKPQPAPICLPPNHLAASGLSYSAKSTYPADSLPPFRHI